MHLPDDACQELPLPNRKHITSRVVGPGCDQRCSDSEPELQGGSRRNSSMSEPSIGGLKGDTSKVCEVAESGRSHTHKPTRG